MYSYIIQSWILMISNLFGILVLLFSRGFYCFIFLLSCNVLCLVFVSMLGWSSIIHGKGFLLFWFPCSSVCKAGFILFVLYFDEISTKAIWVQRYLCWEASNWYLFIFNRYKIFQPFLNFLGQLFSSCNFLFYLTS